MASFQQELAVGRGLPPRSARVRSLPQPGNRRAMVSPRAEHQLPPPLFPVRSGFPQRDCFKVERAGAAIAGSSGVPIASLGPTIPTSKYRALHARFVSADQSVHDHFIAARVPEMVGTEWRSRPLHGALGYSRTTTPRATVRHEDPPSAGTTPSTTPARPGTPLVRRLDLATPSKITQMTAASIAMIEREMIHASGAKPAASAPPPPPPPPAVSISSSLNPRALPQELPVNLAPVEVALAKCEAAVAAAREEGSSPRGAPSRDRVEVARAHLRETKRALAALRGDVAASLGTLQAQMAADVQAAFAEKGWAPPPGLV